MIYTIKENGDLSWYRHDGRSDGSFNWAAGSGNKISEGWQGYTHVFSGGDGIIYAVEELTRDPRIGHGEVIGGHLLWFRHDGWRDGSPTLVEGPKRVGNGWNVMASVFAGENGVVYGIKDDGDLLWYRHDGRNDGTFVWAEGSGNKVGNGWQNFSSVFYGGDGVIYAVEERTRDVREGHGEAVGGHLKWYRHDGWRDGSRTWSGGPKTVGNRWDTLTTLFSGSDGPSSKAAQEIAQFHKDKMAILSVGSVVGAVIPQMAGTFEQPYTFGSISKPLGGTPVFSGRFIVSIDIAAIRCYHTDDPGGTDEPYLITTVYALDPSRPEESLDTRRISNGDGIGDIEGGDVFAHSRQIANSVFIPGDGNIAIRVQLWDEEMVGSTANLRDATNAATQAAIAAGLTAINVPIGGLAAVLGGATGLLNTIGEEVGGWVADLAADLVGDDLLGQREYIIPSSFLYALTTADDPAQFDRTSDHIPGVTYNFPQIAEDDTWLFNEEDKGAYRIYFKVNRLARV
ncbi:MAG: tachylectin-related carbohydrate-binding protein [Candidatus Promineifilaceae bacterium]